MVGITIPEKKRSSFYPKKEVFRTNTECSPIQDDLAWSPAYLEEFWICADIRVIGVSGNLEDECIHKPSDFIEMTVYVCIFFRFLET